MRYGLALALCIRSSLAVFAQDVPTIQAGTQIVVVDVTVTDGQGHAVHNLQQADFGLSENGSPQRIHQFEEHTAPTATDLARMTPLPKLEANVFTNFVAAPENSPVNALLIDSLNTPIERQSVVRQQLIAFVKALTPGTRLAVFSLDKRLTLLQGITSDAKLLLAAVSSNATLQESPQMMGDSPESPFYGHNPDAVVGMRQLEMQQASRQDGSRVRSTLEAMNQLARYLSGMPGRKNIVWISSSFPLNFAPAASTAHLSVITENFDANMRKSMDLFTRSQIAVYAVDAGGLANTSLADAGMRGPVNNAGLSETLRNGQNSMLHIAEATGGKSYLNTNGIRQAVIEAIGIGSNYYTLIYSPADKKLDRSFRKITVHLQDQKYVLNYRSGYYADPPASGSTLPFLAVKPGSPAEQPMNAMHTAMRRGSPPSTEILFKALLQVDPKMSDKLAEGNVSASKSKGPYRLVTVAYAVNPGDITMPARPDGTRQVALEFVAVVCDREGYAFTQQVNPVNVFVKPEGYRQFLVEGVRYQQQIAVPAKGEYYLRAGVHDLIGDRIGVIEVPVAVAIAR